ncbi:putative naringenin-chalcone synthase [Novosphingobium chloroacetimidivorans]|uniref:Putative naringenin-chalcone synthase n=1 Tax=Novosphingobium chloroacetimidivorans TaxID=1428314 RepID=A0A7W7KAG4_9SPHN|nr:type III polyketide synthase [Novosphingobium chloroacetimidivorans]MBB4858498.1 putative naringenin-chalcone synthase [Novosphingobium chloroacetimidivorans]
MQTVTPTTTAHINAIGTAVPPNDVHGAFHGLIDHMLTDRRSRAIYERMAKRSGIESRYSFIEPSVSDDGQTIDSERFYMRGSFASTAQRMERYERWAPELALQAIDQLDDDIASQGITHVVVASCTGFVAPGLDQILIRRTGIDPSAERTLVGFMGCYAAVNALRLAHHIVRSTPEARVLVVNVELCTLHLQETAQVDRLLAMLLFSDGATAALVTAEPKGIALTDFRPAAIPGSADLITWRIGDQGFAMHLDGQVPIRIAEALEHERTRNDADGILRGQQTSDFDLWAVHAGGRSILDAVERGLELPPEALEPSRTVLREKGNMSSATLMFVLARMMAARQEGHGERKGLGMAFGPGLAAETFRFSLL